MPDSFKSVSAINTAKLLNFFVMTDIDPAVREGSFPATSRSYAIAAYEIFKMEPIGSYNAELVKQLTPEMQAKIQNSGTPITN